MAWIESHTTLREHPKTKRLCRLLGINRREAIGLLHILWWWVLDFAPEGDLSGYSDEDIADSIDWEGDAAQLIHGLTDAGFIDGDRRVHDWDEFAEKWIARRRANAERMRLARAGRSPSSNGHSGELVHSTSGARAPQKPKSVGLPDQPTNRTNQPTGPDQPTSTPLPPPPQAEEGERPRRRGRNGSAQHDEPAMVELTPATPEDGRVWNQARAALQHEVSAANFEQVGRLEPIGRAPDGGLHLRAPPGVAGWSFRPVVVRALFDAGDPAAQHTTIVEAG